MMLTRRSCVRGIALFCWIVLICGLGRNSFAAEPGGGPVAKSISRPSSIFYTPRDGYVADVIPFYRRGEYQLFYLKDQREKPDWPGTSWGQVVTRDFFNYQDWGIALPRSPEGHHDRCIFTGSAIERQGVYHIFYTGVDFEKYKTSSTTKEPPQRIMHATSADGRKWVKDPAFFMTPPQEKGYEFHHWRDPLVFWNDEAGEYWMLITARRAMGTEKSRGLIALAASKDLKDWQVREPFYRPDEPDEPECPDLFKMGDWWYLAYSCQLVTHYRMSHSLKGPWTSAPDPFLDGHMAYAIKTAGDGRKRFAFGFLATREGERDAGSWQWGGNLVVHELVQRPDGSLGARLPRSLAAKFGKKVPFSPKTVQGSWKIKKDVFVNLPSSPVSTLRLGRLPDPCLIEATVNLKNEKTVCGLFVRADEGLGIGYQISLSAAGQRMTFDRWPQSPDSQSPLHADRRVILKPGQPVRLTILIDGDAMIIHANDEAALSTRIYDHKAGFLGLYASEGEAQWSDVALRVRE